MAPNYVYGPTFEEMLHPEKMKPEVRQQALRALNEDILNPINLYNITWKDEDSRVRYFILPKELTGVDANIVVLYGRHFPTGSHKVGPTYSISMERQLFGEITPGRDTLVWPSTGNYGIGGAWVGPRLGYDSLVILPELMSEERFQKIESFGAKYIKTPGCESDVKEIFDKCKELKAQDPKYKVLNQFESMGNYRFHYYVTGNSIVEAIKEMEEEGIGNGRVSAFVSAMGSGGTIAAGDLLKQKFSEANIIGLEPIQCRTIFSNGYGGHDIQGIGDKHVTWVHNVMNMDAIMCIDDMESKEGLWLLSDPEGQEYLANDIGISEDKVRFMSDVFGISAICNILGAIKTAKYYGFGSRDNIVTIATDSLDRYHSVMNNMQEAFGKMDKIKAASSYRGVFQGAKLDYIEEGTVRTRERWTNLKYYTWVEQQGKTLQELNAQKSQEWWVKHQELIGEFDKKLKAARGD